MTATASRSSRLRPRLSPARARPPARWRAGARARPVPAPRRRTCRACRAARRPPTTGWPCRLPPRRPPFHRTNFRCRECATGIVTISDASPISIITCRNRRSRRSRWRIARHRGCWCCIAKSSAGKIARFASFPQFLQPGDCLVLNDSRVFPSRLFGHRAGVLRGRQESEAWNLAVGGGFLLSHVMRKPGPLSCIRGARCALASGVLRWRGGRGDRARRIRRADRAVSLRRRYLRAAAENRPRAAAALHQARRTRGGPRALPDRVRPRERVRSPRPLRGCTSRRRFWKRAAPPAPKSRT